MARLMPSDDAYAEERPNRELRSEFLRGQMRDWMDQVVAAGRTPELFELEKWPRALQRLLRIKEQPPSARGGQELALLIDRKFKPIHDRITNATVSAIIRGVPEAGVRRQAAKIFLELFRLLHYLEFADPERVSEEDLKNTVLVFALITSETRLLLAYIERRVLRNVDPESRLHEIYDSFVYSLPFEMKKVISTELVAISGGLPPLL